MLSNKSTTWNLPSRPRTVIPKKSGRKGLKFLEKRKKANSQAIFNISSSNIRMYTSKEMKKIAVVRITNDSHEAESGSVSDPFMGPTNPGDECPFCHEIACIGHYGYIPFLGTTIPHPYYIADLISILTSVCNTCGEILVPKEVIERECKHTHYRTRLSILKCMSEKLVCTRGTEPNSQDKPCSLNPKFIISDLKEKGVIKTLPRRKDKKKIIIDKGPMEVLSMDMVKILLEKLIKPDNARLLGFSAGAHPAAVLMSGILVNPNVSRPITVEQGYHSLDKLSVMYIDIFRKVQGIRVMGIGGIKPKQQKGKKKALNIRVTSVDLYKVVREVLVKTDAKKHVKDFLSIAEQIQGKKAQMRENLMGKRNDYTGRTVSGCESSADFGQTRVPVWWKRILTKPVKVFRLNMTYIQDLLDNGMVVSILPKGGVKRAFRSNRSNTVRLGDIVNRVLQEGDWVTAGRQPSLHKQSLMGHRVILGTQLNTGLHLSVTPAMNNDFDGDENNIQDIQDLEAEAEVKYIMNVIYNVMSTENNRPIMGLVMNSVTAPYLMSDPNSLLEPSVFTQILNMIKSDGKDTLNQRLKLHNIHPYSTRALLSALFPPDFVYSSGPINTDVADLKVYPVRIYNGILVSGSLTKKNVGTSDRSIIQDLWKLYSPQRVATFITDATKMSNKWLMERGFTIGIKDIVSESWDPVDRRYVNENQRIIEDELAKIDVQAAALGPRKSDPLEEALRQKSLRKLVDAARSVGNKLAKGVLSKYMNSIGILTEEGAGTKGTVANIGQIMGLIGQQFWRGKILEPSITGNTRLLPGFPPNSNDPRAYGFIPQSFSQGLNPEGLFFLHKAAREGLLDTALKTSETGTLHRRTGKANENIIVAQDYSVRNTNGNLYSTLYNGGYNIAGLMKSNAVHRTNAPSFIDVRALFQQLNIQRGWYPSLITQINKLNQDLFERQQYYGLPQDYDEIEVPTALPAEATDINIPLDQPEIAATEKLSVFEKTRLIGTRAIQIANDMDPYDYDLIGDLTSPLEIAEREYEAGLLNNNLYVIRHYGNERVRVNPDLIHVA